MTPLQPLSEDTESTPPFPRRRRARSLLPFLGQEERDQALDDLARRAFPGVDFFLFTLLTAFLISLSFVFSSPVLLIAGLAFSPLLGPLTGTALGLVTGSFPFAARNLAALALSWILAFFAAWAGAYLFSFLSVAGAVPPLLDGVTVLVVCMAAAMLTWRFLRGADDAWIPNLVVSYGCLFPVCAAAFFLANGNGGEAQAAELTWGIHSSLAFLASVAAYLVFGFRPSGRSLGAFAGMAAAVGIGAVLLAAWGGVARPAPRPAGTLEPVMLPTASPTRTLRPSITLSPTISPLPTETPAPSETFTPTPPPVPALVQGTGGQGVFLRDSPGMDGKKIASLQEGEAVEVLGPPVEKDGTWWVPVRIKSGITGWMALEFCATLTPTATRA
jgi:hypothetical protein